MLYKFDENKYYSSTSNTYFEFYYNSDNLIDERKIIMIGFDITIRSKRIFILPRFNCSLIKKYKNNLGKKCTYADIFKYHLIDKTFKNKFRENVFLFIYHI